MNSVARLLFSFETVREILYLATVALVVADFFFRRLDLDKDGLIPLKTILKLFVHRERR